MLLLKLNDIKNWLIENKSDFQKLQAQDFPPLDNAIYWKYGHLSNFIQYYNYKNQCDKALLALEPENFEELAIWIKQHEILGSQNLLMFEVNYIRWDEEVRNDAIKIHEELYTERKPFESIICFCKVFQHLYWENAIHNSELTEFKKKEIQIKLKEILNNYFGQNNC